MKYFLTFAISSLIIAASLLYAQDSESSSPEAIYAKNCAMCHGEKLDGGPLASSLIDDEWTYGSSKEDVIKIISEGKPDKAMPAWKDKLSEEEISDLAEWILDQ